VPVGQLHGGDRHALGLGAHTREEGGVWCGARHAAEEKRGVWRSTHVAAAGAERSRDRSLAGDTDPDASGAGGAGLLRAVREQRRRREREKDETDMRALGV
jgi:hypothetical protein